jgi:hypothetical protein
MKKMFAAIITFMIHSSEENIDNVTTYRLTVKNTLQQDVLIHYVSVQQPTSVRYFLNRNGSWVPWFNEITIEGTLLIPALGSNFVLLSTLGEKRPAYVKMRRDACLKEIILTQPQTETEI